MLVFFSILLWWAVIFLPTYHMNMTLLVYDSTDMVYEKYLQTDFQNQNSFSFIVICTAFAPTYEFS